MGTTLHNEGEQKREEKDNKLDPIITLKIIHYYIITRDNCNYKRNQIQCAVKLPN